MLDLLEGRNVNLRIAEKEDVPLLMQWFNKVRFTGDYANFPVQISKNQLEPQILEHKLYGHEWVTFIVEKKDGTKIGIALHYISAPNFGWVEIGYTIIPEERNKGYATEAAQILTDCLFLTEIFREFKPSLTKKIWLPSVFSKMADSRRKADSGRHCRTPMEDGPTAAYTAYSGKSGKYQEYLQNSLRKSEADFVLIVGMEIPIFPHTQLS